MMTATATPKTIRILESQLPEISKWRYLLNPPLRKNVVTIVPPPEALSNKVEVLLEPFIHDMKEHQTTYLILVRGNFFIQSLDFFLQFMFPLKGINKGTRVYLHLLKVLNDPNKEHRQIAFYHRNTSQGRKQEILTDLKLPLGRNEKKILCVIATVSLGMILIHQHK